MERQLYELSKQELIAVIQDYQEMFSELEELCNSTVTFRNALDDILYKKRPGWKIYNQSERYWTLRPYSSPQALKKPTKPVYSDAELVDKFLCTTNNWYIDKANSMFGWRDKVRAELIRCLTENDEANSDHQLIYAEMKFRTEWIGPEGMFVECQKEDANDV